MKSFRSNGKLLLTAEYTVLDGALALAVPTQMGQCLQVENSDSKGVIYWRSFDETGRIWYEDTIEIDRITSNKRAVMKSDTSQRLLQILKAVNTLRPHFLSPDQGFEISTHLDFNRRWGLGSSSTLINNISHWAEVDAFKLLQLTFGGSGYDIACAQYDTPILYQLQNRTKPKIHPVAFAPVYADHLYFVYLNQKQNSREGIASYKRLNKRIKSVILEEISHITKMVVKSDSLMEFNSLIVKHEQLISGLINDTPVKAKYFNDFEGEVKSLGAWGGDFVLASSITDPSSYFKDKGYDVVIPYSKMVLKSQN